MIIVKAITGILAHALHRRKSSQYRTLIRDSGTMSDTREFFEMTVISTKLSLNFPHDAMQMIACISTDELYARAVEEQVGMHACALIANMVVFIDANAVEDV